MASRVLVKDLEPGMKVPRWVLRCSGCSEVFLGYQDAQYCSDACRQAAFRGRPEKRDKLSERD